jgi:hypothetical protein
MSKLRLLVVFVGPEGPMWPYGDGNGDSLSYHGAGTGSIHGTGTGDGSFAAAADGDGWCQGDIDHAAFLRPKEETE